MWKKAAAHASVRGSATDEWLQGLRGRCQSAPTPKSPRLMVPPPPHPHLLFQLSSFITRSLLIYAFLLSCHVQNIRSILIPLRRHIYGYQKLASFSDSLNLNNSTLIAQDFFFLGWLSNIHRKKNR